MKDHVLHYKSPAPPLFSPNLSQLQMEYKLLHLRTHLLTISSPEGLLFPVFSSTRRVFKTSICKDQQQLKILKCQTNLGVVSLLLKHELYNSVILVAVKLVIKTPKGFLCCLLLSREFNDSDVSPPELCNFRTKIISKATSQAQRKRLFLPPPGFWLPWPLASVPVPPLTESICRIPHAP